MPTQRTGTIPFERRRPWRDPVATPSDKVIPRKGTLNLESVAGRGPDAERHRRIAERAYRRAERRGFAPGQELNDWLAAEAEERDSDDEGARGER
jgi:hypothetical protein